MTHIYKTEMVKINRLGLAIQELNEYAQERKLEIVHFELLREQMMVCIVALLKEDDGL